MEDRSDDLSHHERYNHVSEVLYVSFLSLYQNKSLLDDENYHKMMEYKIQDDMMAGKFGMDCTRRGSVDPDRVNITEEMAKTSIWKNVTYESRCENEYIK